MPQYSKVQIRLSHYAGSNYRGRNFFAQFIFFLSERLHFNMLKKKLNSREIRKFFSLNCEIKFCENIFPYKGHKNFQTQISGHSLEFTRDRKIC